jgi:hypothetical protein
MASEEELNKLTVNQLKEQLTPLGLSTKGRKAELVERLLEVSSRRFVSSGSPL